MMTHSQSEPDEGVTALEKILREMMVLEGPLPLDRYMGLCLGHPQHGYYMRQQPFGETGDFITAPETSQVFGELIGIWCVGAWEALGRPDPCHLIELGPGRGLLLRDLLRAAKVVPDFIKALRLHLVEMSPQLQQAQAAQLAGFQVSWHHHIETVPAGPCLIIANEFFDALPIQQFEWRVEKGEGRWFERVIWLEGIGLEGMGLVPASAHALAALAGYKNIKPGDVVELAPQRLDYARRLAERLQGQLGAALIIDYGYLHSAPGDTLQALRAHRFVPITHRPGESDITAHVDFDQLKQAFASAGLEVAAALTQAEFLKALGAEPRFAQLRAKAAPDLAAKLLRQEERLLGEAEMGELFKVMLALSPDLRIPYPFGKLGAP